MRILAIQNSIKSQPILATRKVSKMNESVPQPQTVSPSFKGAKGGLLGLGGGLITGLIIFAGGAITGGLILPTLVGAAGVLASGAAGTAAGHKIEDKVKGK